MIMAAIASLVGLGVTLRRRREARPTPGGSGDASRHDD
jgi:hypothetical protein